jgi:heme exporter protein D
MAFDSWADFLAMGKHGVYVWSSYGLTFAVIAGLLWQARHERGDSFCKIISNK